MNQNIYTYIYIYIYIYIVYIYNVYIYSIIYIVFAYNKYIYVYDVYIYKYICVYIYRILTHFTWRFLQVDVLHTIAFVKLLIIILFDVIYCAERLIWKFFKFVDYPSLLLKKCYWKGINCGGAELGNYDQ